MASACSPRRRPSCATAMEEAIRSRKPTLINAVIDEKAGTESGRITSLNPDARRRNRDGHPDRSTSSAAQRNDDMHRQRTNDGKALDGVKILDFTHVQSGPTCTQLLAWFGADVIKVERAGAGDITRGQLRDIPDVDSLYFTMLNHNKRSITIDTKNPKGKEVLETLIKKCDVLVENFAPGRARPHGLHLGAHPGAQPADDRGLGQGLRPRPATRTARSTRTSRNAPAARPRPPASTTARRWSPVPQIGDTAPACTLALGIVTALYQRNTTGTRPEGVGRDAGRRAQPVPRQAARPAAPRPHRGDGRVSAVPERQVRRRGAARRQCRRAAASRAGS